ncbi:acyl carrier protein [Streptomyces sp. NPDC046371]|uniref:acyl carrier protein n=1 Tax=unclassified Streptomyces TaxID=2593676 RepID=UPI0033EB4ACC
MTFDELKSTLIGMGMPPEQLNPDALRDEAGLDSLFAAELALILRQEKGIRIPEEEILAAATLADVAAAVAHRAGAGAGAER